LGGGRCGIHTVDTKRVVTRATFGTRRGPYSVLHASLSTSVGHRATAHRPTSLSAYMYNGRPQHIKVVGLDELLDGAPWAISPDAWQGAEQRNATTMISEIGLSANSRRVSSVHRVFCASFHVLCGVNRDEQNDMLQIPPANHSSLGAAVHVHVHFGMQHDTQHGTQSVPRKTSGVDKMSCCTTRASGIRIPLQTLAHMCGVLLRRG